MKFFEKLDGKNKFILKNLGEGENFRSKILESTGTRAQIYFDDVHCLGNHVTSERSIYGELRGKR